MSTKATGPVKTKKDNLIDKVKNTITDLWGSTENALESLQSEPDKAKSERPTQVTGENRATLKKTTAKKPVANTQPATKRSVVTKTKPQAEAGTTPAKAAAKATKRMVIKKSTVAANSMRKKAAASK